MQEDLINRNQKTGKKKTISMFKSKFKGALEGLLPDQEHYDGKQLPVNIVRLPKTIQRIIRISLGETHMIAHCIGPNNKKGCIYGVGGNKWGQLGLNPMET